MDHSADFLRYVVFGERRLNINVHSTQPADECDVTWRNIEEVRSKLVAGQDQAYEGHGGRPDVVELLVQAIPRANLCLPGHRLKIAVLLQFAYEAARRILHIEAGPKRDCLAAEVFGIEGFGGSWECIEEAFDGRYADAEGTSHPIQATSTSYVSLTSRLPLRDVCVRDICEHWKRSHSGFIVCRPD
jgi:hypothetical protein